MDCPRTSGLILDYLTLGASCGSAAAPTQEDSSTRSYIRTHYPPVIRYGFPWHGDNYGLSTFVIEEAQVFSASIISKFETSSLTWEGVGYDLYGDNTRGLTGDQEHQKSIILMFTEADTYMIKAGFSDEVADNSPQYPWTTP